MNLKWDVTREKEFSGVEMIIMFLLISVNKLQPGKPNDAR